MSVDTSFYHQLTNSSLGTDQALEVNPRGQLRMERKGASSGQLWTLVERGGGKYALRTELLGDCSSLDVVNDDKDDTPWLAKEADNTGQSWTLTPQSDGTYKLANDFTGPDKFLDTTADTHKPFLSRGDQPGQRWTLTPVRRIEGIPGLDQADFGLYKKPAGVVKAVMVFVDFSDAEAGSASADDLAWHLLGDGKAKQVLRDQSYQKMELDVIDRSDLKWKRMPKKTSFYKTHGDFYRHRKYIEDAAGLFAEVKFSDYDLVLVAASKDADLAGASSFTAGAGDGARSASGEIRLAVTFDKNSHSQMFTTLVHEVSHLFGLPDLYKYTSKNAEDSLAGSWSIMSDSHRSFSLLGWERHKLGWLHSSRKTYVAKKVTGWSATLHPLSDPCGLSMIVLPIDDDVNPSKVFVIELAQSYVGKNAQPWGDGVLLYTVDASIASGDSPIKVIPKTAGYSPDYGNLYQAPCPAGDSLPHSEGGASVTLHVGRKLGSSYEVKIDYKR